MIPSIERRNTFQHCCLDHKLVGTTQTFWRRDRQYFSKIFKIDTSFDLAIN